MTSIAANPVTENPTHVRGRWSKFAPLLGLVFVVMVVASVSLSNTPNTSNSPASILAYYQAHTGQVRASAFLVPPAVVIGLFWFAYLRNWLQRRDVHERWGAVAFAGGILFAVTGAVAAGILLALVDTPRHLTPATATALNFLEGRHPGHVGLHGVRRHGHRRRHRDDQEPLSADLVGVVQRGRRHPRGPARR